MGHMLNRPQRSRRNSRCPKQDTNHHEKDWRDALQKWRPHGDLDLREDGNLPEDDTVSGFEDIYPGNPGTAVGAAAAAPAPVAAVPPPLQPIVPQELPIGARNIDAGPEDTGLLQSHHESSSSGPLNSVTPSDCLNPPTSGRASVNSHGRRNPSLCMVGPDAGRDGAVSQFRKHSHNSMVRNSNLDLDGAHAKSPLKVEEKLTVPQQDTTPHDHHILQRQRRDDHLENRNVRGDDSGLEDSDPGNPGEAAALPQELPRNIGARRSNVVLFYP